MPMLHVRLCLVNTLRTANICLLYVANSMKRREDIACIGISSLMCHSFTLEFDPFYSYYV
jgi:hypothetical protein